MVRLVDRAINTRVNAFVGKMWRVVHATNASMVFGICKRRSVALVVNAIQSEVEIQIVVNTRVNAIVKQESVDLCVVFVSMVSMDSRCMDAKVICFYVFFCAANTAIKHFHIVFF